MGALEKATSLSADFAVNKMCKHNSLQIVNGVSICQRCHKVIDSKSLFELYLERLEKHNKSGKTGKIRDLDPKEVARGD